MRIFITLLLFYVFYHDVYAQNIPKSWVPSFSRLDENKYHFFEKKIAVSLDDKKNCEILPNLRDSLLVLSDFLKTNPNRKIEIQSYKIPQAISLHSRCIAIKIKTLLIADGVPGKQIFVRNEAIKINPHEVVYLFEKEDDYKNFAFLNIDFSPYYPPLSHDRKYFSFNDSVYHISEGDINILSVLFVFGKCDFYPEFRDTIALLANFLVKNQNIEVEIGVHNDSRNVRYASYSTSQCRAEAISKCLIEKGVSPSQFKCIGYGATVPIISDDEILNAANEDIREEYYKMNRRVEVKIISIKH